MIRKHVIAAATLAAALVATAPAHAVTIGFDDRSHLEAVTNQYAGLGVTFAGATILQAPNYNVESYPPHSGTNVIYNEVGDIRLTFSSLISNFSAYASTSSTLVLTAYGVGGNVIGFSSLGQTLNTNAFIGITGNGIASVLFSSGSQNNTTLDDITFDAMTSAAPEPGTWAMMILGFGFAGVALRRRIKASEVNFTKKVRSIAAV